MPGFESLAHPEQEYLLFKARDAMSLYAENHDKNYWHTREAEYCQYWLAWYDDKRSTYKGSDAVPPQTVAEHYLSMIGFLGEALYSADKYPSACDHFAHYTQIEIPRAKWLITWANALVENQGPAWEQKTIDSALRRAFAASGKHADPDIVARWKSFYTAIDKFVRQTPQGNQGEWPYRLKVIRSRLVAFKLLKK